MLVLVIGVRVSGPGLNPVRRYLSRPESPAPSPAEIPHRRGVRRANPGRGCTRIPTDPHGFQTGNRVAIHVDPFSPVWIRVRVFVRQSAPDRAGSKTACHSHRGRYRNRYRYRFRSRPRFRYRYRPRWDRFIHCLGRRWGKIPLLDPGICANSVLLWSRRQRPGGPRTSSGWCR